MTNYENVTIITQNGDRCNKYELLSKKKKRIRRFNQKQEIVTGWCNVLLESISIVFTTE
jgi:hypothetical protein